MNVWKTMSLVMFGYLLGNSHYGRSRYRYSYLKDSLDDIIIRKFRLLALGREESCERRSRLPANYYKGSEPWRKRYSSFDTIDNQDSEKDGEDS